MFTLLCDVLREAVDTDVATSHSEAATVLLTGPPQSGKSTVVSLACEDVGAAATPLSSAWFAMSRSDAAAAARRLTDALAVKADAAVVVIDGQCGVSCVSCVCVVCRESVSG